MQTITKTMDAQWAKHRLRFRVPARTSRGKIREKDVYYLRLVDDNGNTSYGECAPFPGLGCDCRPDYESRLDNLCRSLKTGLTPAWLDDYPSIDMGLRTALAWMKPGMTFPPITINGLVWMDTTEKMLQQAMAKARAGFKVIKFKIGALDFESELEMIKSFRLAFRDVTIRLDANGAFTPRNVMERLERLLWYDIHSIEQPLPAGRWDQMADVCHYSPIPIALDEELIGLNTPDERRRMMETIRPRYLVIKPSLTGWTGGVDWVKIAGEHGAGWWATSALESNIGLSGVAMFTSQFDNKLPSGLGTGSLFTNNVQAPLRLEADRILHVPALGFSVPDGLEWN